MPASGLWVAASDPLLCQAPLKLSRKDLNVLFEIISTKHLENMDCSQAE